MKDKAFLDTNILIYCYTKTELEKQIKARQVANLSNTVISTQVLKELTNILRKKFNIEWPIIHSVLTEVEGNFEIYENNANSIRRACEIADKYQFSFYDSLIIAAALYSNCKILFSEDLQNGQLIERVLMIKNPFL